MVFRHGKNTALWLNSFDISPFFNEASTSQKADTPETTAFGVGAKTYVVGQQEGSVALKGLWDGSVDAVDSQLTAAVGVEPDQVFTFGIEGVTFAGAVKLMAVQETDYQVTTPVADVVSITATLQANGAIDGGRLLTGNTSLAATTNGSSVDNGALSANGGAAHLHATVNTRTTATTVKIQHSADNSTFVDLVTFTVVPAATTASERIVVAARTTVNRFVRAQSTLTAGSGAITITAAFARR